jgi:ElaB/YqjD/DUF883 family membrane-anchored ribosome-binding protein
MKASTSTTDSETTTNGQDRATVEDLKALILEAQEALENVGESATVEVQALRDRLRQVLSEGRHTIKGLADAARRQAGRADDAIRANPYPTIGVAAGLGLIAGILLSRACAGSSR